MEKSLRGLARRARYFSDSTQAYALFLLHYDELKACYESFFPDVKKMAKQALEQAGDEF
jgi:acyl carrier protein phosphodiesterase